MKLDVREEKSTLRSILSLSDGFRSNQPVIHGAVMKQRSHGAKLHQSPYGGLPRNSGYYSRYRSQRQHTIQPDHRATKSVDRWRQLQVRSSSDQRYTLTLRRSFTEQRSEIRSNRSLHHRKNGFVTKEGSFASKLRQRDPIARQTKKTIKGLRKSVVTAGKGIPYIGQVFMAGERLREDVGMLGKVFRSERDSLRNATRTQPQEEPLRSSGNGVRSQAKPEQQASWFVKTAMKRFRDGAILALTIIFPPFPLILSAVVLLLVIIVTGAFGIGLLAPSSPDSSINHLISEGNVRIERQLLEDDYTFPLPRGYSQISSGFDSTRRFAPADYILGGHVGVDFPVPIGTPVYAFKSGTVVEADIYSDGAMVVAIKHPKGDVSRYIHLSKMLVTHGQNVKVGDLIALSGNSGQSSGPHLHFQYETDGSKGWAKSAVDPMPMFKQNASGEWLSLKEYARLSGNSTETKKEIQ